MDEQTIQQEQTAQESNLSENSIPEDEPSSEVTGDDGQEPEISIQDGEVKFSDDFFGDIPDNADDDEDLKPKSLEGKTQLSENEPKYYTDEDLQNIPFEQWDKARMPDDVRRYVEAYTKQQEALARQREFQQRAQTVPSFLTPPKQYTPQELYDEAMKAAVQKLGLNSADDFDAYEGLHQTALAMARQEIMQKNAVDTANYQRNALEYQRWQMFSGQIAAQADYNDFHQWYLNEVKKNGNTPEQIDAGLERIAREQGYGAVQQVWSELYKQFRASKTPKPAPVQRTRAKTPSPLEGTRGGSNEGRRIVDVRNFGNLDEDAQAQALIDMGIV